MFNYKIHSHLKARQVLELKTVINRKTTEHRFWFEDSGHTADTRGLETLNSSVLAEGSAVSFWHLYHVMSNFIQCS